MCLWASIISAAVGLTTGVVSGLISTAVQTQAINDQNQSAADQYELELRNEEMRMNMEREEAALQAQNEAVSETLSAADEQIQIAQNSARSEAANASLNVSGNTPLRSVGAFDVQKNVAMGRHGQNMETISDQYLMRQQSAIEQYGMNSESAYLSAKSKMQSGAPWWATTLNVLMPGTSGAQAGLSLYSSAKDVGWGGDKTTTSTTGGDSGVKF